LLSPAGHNSLLIISFAEHRAWTYRLLFFRLLFLLTISPADHIAC
jgi:hypothetical protein